MYKNSPANWFPLNLHPLDGSLGYCCAKSHQLNLKSQLYFEVTADYTNVEIANQTCNRYSYNKMKIYYRLGMLCTMTTIRRIKQCIIVVYKTVQLSHKILPFKEICGIYHQILSVNYQWSKCTILEHNLWHSRIVCDVLSSDIPIRRCHDRSYFHLKYKQIVILGNHL